MKVKIIEVSCNESIKRDYWGDLETAITSTVNDSTDWVEVSNQEFTELETFVRDANLTHPYGEYNKLFLLNDSLVNAARTQKRPLGTIQECLAAAREDQKKKKAEEEKYKKDAAKREQQSKAKAIEKKRRQLEKLKKELGETDANDAS